MELRGALHVLLGNEPDKSSGIGALEIIIRAVKRDENVVKARMECRLVKWRG